ncbi:hypothetical protein B0H16DRAFT_1815828 [Mycena metata]|uniref:Uncharacterized protein n=1 Tax=Mycena metata TaxID=1033252 RepID=A0AAD7MD99_9AGAR|nr:hypothetical protein B0H16DRAFT_1815828 [Mycena metata]
MHDRDTTAETLLMRDLESNRSLTPPLALEGKHPATSSQSRWAPLQSSASIVFSVLCYTAMAVIAWTATCYLSFKPIGAKHYGVDIVNTDNNGYGAVISGTDNNGYGAVISGQAYHQFYASTYEARNEKKHCLVVSYCRYFLESAWRYYCPLQQLFLSTATIKTPIWPIIIDQIDLMDHFNNKEPLYDFGETTALLRDRLGSTGTTDLQAQLWSRNTTSNSPFTDTYLIAGEQYAFGNMSQLEDPFLTQLPSGFSTGLIHGAHREHHAGRVPAEL